MSENLDPTPLINDYAIPWGINTNSLVALLGAAGLAIGLSLHSSLQNFAAGVMLIVFRPFKDGDYRDVLFDTTEKVKLEFDANGISIPYPQMELHMNQPSEQAN